MSIEDINYLYKNSVKDNAIIFIESNKRDKNIYPTPSEYTITFDNPFKYVYGLEVLDASMPRTMYQIDKTNNNLKIVLGDANYHIYKTAIYDPGGHILTTLEQTKKKVIKVIMVILIWIILNLQELVIILDYMVMGH